MSLPADFLFGFATAAAQIEGGGEKSERASGRGLSVRSFPVPSICNDDCRELRFVRRRYGMTFVHNLGRSKMDRASCGLVII